MKMLTQKSRLCHDESFFTWTDGTGVAEHSDFGGKPVSDMHAKTKEIGFDVRAEDGSFTTFRHVQSERLDSHFWRFEADDGRAVMILND